MGIFSPLKCRFIQKFSYYMFRAGKRWRSRRALTRHYYMSPQFSAYLSILTLFNSQLFSPLFNTDFTDDLIILTWTIKNSIYTIEIFNDGSINGIISNTQSKDRVDRCELSTIFEMVNQAYICYTDKSKLSKYITFAYS